MGNTIKQMIGCLLVVVMAQGAMADCPSMDATGDCLVNLEDFAVFASQWLDEGVMPYSDLTKDHIAAMEAEMSTASIDASDGNEFMPGTYFIYKTDEGRFGKFMVENYEPDESCRLTIKWATYNADGSVFSQGARLVIRGTWTCDLDFGLETVTGKDWNWVLQTSTVRRLFPQNGAKFKLMHRAIAPDGMVWVYIDASASSGYDGYMSKYETTNDQYCQYLNAALADGEITVYNNIVYAASDTDHDKPYFDTYAADTDSQIIYSGGTFSVRTRDSYYMGNHPVVEVSWYGGTAFCNYYGYRLPTEWQWQAVADYDGSYNYGCGTIIDHNKANYDDVNPLNLSNYPYTSPVDHYLSYGYGMNDMAGNVREWTDSWYSSNHSSRGRVLRGGCWGNSAPYCQVTYRFYGMPSIRDDGVGFRLVLDLN